MAQSVIEALLKSKIGLDVNSIGSRAIASAIYQRMVNCGISQMSSYLGYLQDFPQEWQALIDSVIVPETWFFREPESFALLKSYVLSEWLPQNSQKVLQVLSVPCATGEEPYSIAIALLETGLTSAQFRIDAVDISQKCLLKAQKAIYDKYSFRGSNFEFQERYFQSINSEYYLQESVKKSVNFINGNLADPHFLVNTQVYDVVFCRNLLIYFDHQTKEQTLHILERLIVAGGLLFVASAEAALLMKTQLVSVQHFSAIAYQKLIKPHNFEQENYTNYQSTIYSQLPTQTSAEIPIKNKPEISYQTPIKANNFNTNLLDLAKTAANQGRLEDAVKLCNDYLNQNQMNAEAYVLLGEVQQAMGQNEPAIQSFRKAIYLQPNHEAALTHLALLKEQQGDRAGASLLWQRIYRLQR
ncbi:MCP methyltransferase, CheR-type with Tpr repeats [Anabaenopsis circularis NIES-21]|uniref:MCP methyltransferase, CheR-type with Tpr repeats n=1 Tax=Anabaenopsis circularis NIES-21 TaxID=1085406 RepID=A0A1Z4GI50_9CYAN|nr:MCP methyltransferase, CheR-type with Tpr repeats [Anabaenopsis circularis NIES-21]